MTRFICLKQGHKYGVEYVNILHNRIRAYLPSMSEFICYTDTPDMKFDEGITIVNLPHIPNMHGWWWKCWILGADHPGNNLYMDLDMLIVGDCSVYQPRNQGLTGIWNRIHLNSSILAWRDSLPCVWTRFQERRGSYMGAGGVVGDQEVINDCVDLYNLKLDFFEDAHTAWLEVKDEQKLARNWNENTKTVVCKGARNPHEHLEHPLVRAYWRRL